MINILTASASSIVNYEAIDISLTTVVMIPGIECESLIVIIIQAGLSETGCFLQRSVFRGLEVRMETAHCSFPNKNVFVTSSMPSSGQ